MGRAIVRDPKVFLFDEPLSNLDAKLRVQMRAEIKALHQRLKTTTVYVTHDQVEAMTMADRIVVMRSGIVEQAGTPLELYDRPANMFVAQFIGSPAMNILTGRGRGDVFVTDDGVGLPVPVSARHRLASATSYGIRPEHFALGGESGVPVTLEVVEPTGAETQLVVRLGGQMVVAAFRDRLDFGRARPSPCCPISIRCICSMPRATGFNKALTMTDSKHSRPCAIVTGAASGIGAATALQLAAEGFDLVINYASNSEGAAQAAERCRSQGVQVIVMQGDIANDADCRAIAEAADRGLRADRCAGQQCRGDPLCRRRQNWMHPMPPISSIFSASMSSAPIR